MNATTSLFLLFMMMLVGALGLLAIVVAFWVRPARQSRVGLVVAVSPPLVMLASFYSLAIHMYRSLGAWPNYIGERGFSASLILHAQIATGYFGVLLLATIIVWPIVFLVCLIVRRWRGCVYYLGVYAFSYCVSLALMLLAPSAYWVWWWD
ncbi:MAG TPA: hypothetical protein VMV72_02405 [Verrucomicrobiae bacterium]|nr:hypothetical protein [Verrucomicrobiae bacterium]